MRLFKFAGTFTGTGNNTMMESGRESHARKPCNARVSLSLDKPRPCLASTLTPEKRRGPVSDLIQSEP